MLLPAILSNPAWQGLGVIIALLLGIIGFYTGGQKQDKRWLYIAGTIVLVIIAFGVGAEVQRQLANVIAPSASSGTVAPVAISGAKGEWQPTGVAVLAGQVVTMHVVGGGWTVSRKEVPRDVYTHLPPPLNEGNQVWRYAWSETNGTGFDSCTGSDCPLINAPTGALIAKIGGTRYVINDRCVFAVTESGDVFLRMNDNDMRDNGGVLAVDIKIGPADASNNSQNCGAPIP